jgi:hypothetical protein
MVASHTRELKKIISIIKLLLLLIYLLSKFTPRKQEEGTWMKLPLSLRPTLAPVGWLFTDLRP